MTNQPYSLDIIAKSLELDRRRGYVVQRRQKYDNLRNFVAKANPRFVFYRHCELLANVCERVASGELKRVMIQLPPRHSKSELFSRLFSAYYLMKNPTHFVGINSYSAELAYTLSRAARENFIECGGEVRDDAAAVKHWETKQGGGLWAAGVGGSITGKGFHCFPAETRVTTSNGMIDIATLYHSQNRPKVLSYNHLTGTCEWRKITATVKYQTDGALYEITTDRGRKVRATSDHRFFTAENGYQQAQYLEAGDGLISSSISKQQDLSELQKGQGRTRADLLGVLSDTSGRINSAQVCFLQAWLHEAAIRTRKGSTTGVQGFLLLKRMFAEASRNKESSVVQNVSETDRHKDESLLLTKVSATLDAGTDSERATSGGSFLQLLLDYLHAAQFAVCVLWQNLCKQSSFVADGGQGQFALQNGNQLFKMVSGNAPADLGTRQGFLRSVPDAEQNTANDTRAGAISLDYSPFRRTAREQHATESGDALRNMPFGSPSLGTDSVSVVERLCAESVEVYDIEVEGNHNFFANEILVHNCGIIDDPIKNAEEAASEVIREKHKEWYSSTFYTRQEPDAAIVIIQTRWNEDDLTGWLLSEELEGENPEGWHVVSLPALYEDAVHLPPSCTAEGDFRHIEGDALCPERYSAGKLNKIKSRIGEYHFGALYQQRPTAKQGLFFHVDKLEIVDAAPVEAFRGRGWDKAATAGGGDYTAGGKVSKAKDGIYYIEDVIRGQWDTATRDRNIRQTAELDGRSTKQVGEQEPGSGGKESAQAFIKLLAGFPVSTEPATNAKEVRADPLSSQINAGNVRLVRGDWNKAFIEELRQFPHGKHDDQVDAVSLAFNKISRRMFANELKTPQEKLIAQLPEEYRPENIIGLTGTARESAHYHQMAEIKKIEQKPRGAVRGNVFDQMEWK